MLMIRFQRIGRTNNAAFRIVVLEKERAAKSSRVADRLGSYNPHTKAVVLDAERAKHWLANGAQPTDTVRNLFIAKGVLSGKKVNALPSRRPVKKEGAEAPADVAAPAAPVAAEAAPVVEEAAAPEAAPEAAPAA